MMNEYLSSFSTRI